MAEILNDDDPDVSFAYTFCGSSGSSKAAEEAVARGKAKAKIKYVNPVWLPEYDGWVRSVAGLLDKLIVWDYGSCRVCQARAEFKDAEVDLEFESSRITATVRLRLIGATFEIKPGESCIVALRKIVREIKKGEHGVSELNKRLKQSNLFILHDD